MKTSVAPPPRPVVSGTKASVTMTTRERRSEVAPEKSEGSDSDNGSDSEVRIFVWDIT